MKELAGWYFVGEKSKEALVCIMLSFFNFSK